VRARLALPVPARVAPLVTTARRLRPGGRLAVVAPLAPAGAPHDAQLTLSGPHYRATRLVKLSAAGLAGASIRLPKRMAAGTWTISAQEESGVALAPQGGALTGHAQLRMGVFRVRRRR